LGRTRILFTSTVDPPFINEDLRLLSIHYDVERLTTRGVWAPFRILPRVLTADVTYTWFASTYAFWVVTLASLFRKPSIVVIGGVDAAKIPEIGYGIWLSRWKSRLVRRRIAPGESHEASGIRRKKYSVYSIWVRRSVLETRREQGTDRSDSGRVRRRPATPGKGN
jgi:hypothetical protein